MAQLLVEGDGLKLGVGQVELSLDVAYTLEKSGEIDARATAKFWVLASAEAGTKEAVSSVRVRTQHLKLVLTPRIEETVVNAAGAATTVSRGLDVRGQLEAREERPSVLITSP